MISFLFGVLFSVVFWVVYFVAGFVVGTLLIRCYAPNTYEYFKGVEVQYISPFECWVVASLNYIFWFPILVFVFIKMLFKFIFSEIIGEAIKKLFVLIDGRIPKISFKIEKN